MRAGDAQIKALLRSIYAARRSGHSTFIFLTKEARDKMLAFVKKNNSK